MPGTFLVAGPVVTNKIPSRSSHSGWGGPEADGLTVIVKLRQILEGAKTQQKIITGDAVMGEEVQLVLTKKETWRCQRKSLKVKECPVWMSGRALSQAEGTAVSRVFAGEPGGQRGRSG